jgi:hypothetical protein
MKVNYLTDKENTLEDFSDNFRNIENFLSSWPFQKIHEKPPHFSYFPLPKNRRWPENFQDGKNHTHIDVRLSC